jgi:hypothetical protein
MTSAFAPIISTSYFFRTPLVQASAQLSAVWPPMVGRMAILDFGSLATLAGDDLFDELRA